MKTAAAILLMANFVALLWLALGDPLDTSREPRRMQMQIEPERFRVLDDQQIEALRAAAPVVAGAGLAAAGAANPPPAAAGAAPGGPAADAPPPAPELPSPSCVVIGPFSSDTGLRRMRSRLNSLGLAAERISAVPEAHPTHLRVRGVDARTEARIDDILADFTRQSLTHCPDSAEH